MIFGLFHVFDDVLVAWRRAIRENHSPIVYYPGRVLKAIFERSSRAFSGDKVLYHCQPVFCVAKCNCLHGVNGLTAKLYISPIKFAYLSSPRLSMSVLLSLARRSVLHDKARVCRSVSLAESPAR